MILCDFEIWEHGVPVVSLNADPEFELWQYGVPYADVGTALGEEEPEVPTVRARRRVMIF